MTKYPEPVVGGYVFNDRQQVLLVRSPKWNGGDMWLVAGGHVEVGETIKEAVEREIKEELGIKVEFKRVFAVFDGVFPADFHEKRHFIYLQCWCQIAPGEKIAIDGREIVEARWWEVEEALRLPKGKLHIRTREALEILEKEL
ncbi:MAG: NUDIX domain-containing protein [bacterium]|nr:NUDIX domain-containing protein [bacterium]